MERKLVRRSFLGRVIGGGALLLTGPPAASSVRPPRRGLCSDTDTGPGSDPRHAWYGDRDSGPESDPLRHSARYLNDTDAGPNADPPSVRSIGRCGKKRRPEREPERGERG